MYCFKLMKIMHFFNNMIISLSLLLSLLASFSNAQTNSTTFQVGVILDADSLVGRIGLTSLSLSLSDFYTLNANYSTRIALHIRDSRSQITGAAASALDLLKEVRVDAIIGPQKSTQADFVISLGDAAKVPVVSFSATSPSLHPQSSYFVQTAPSDAAQVDAIAALVKHSQWYQVVLVYEDSDYGNGIIPYLSNALQQVNARVSYISVIPVSANDDSILTELYKMKTMQTRVFVVHVSSSLASKFFPKVKEAEMMGEGYAWIVTSGIMDLFYSLDSRVVDSMQGVVGVKPLIRESSRLNSTTVRWKEKFLQDHPGAPQAEMSLFGLWAYDTMWGLAMAVEKVGFREPSSLQNTTDLINSTNMFITEISQTGPKLLTAMLETTFEGLGEKFRLVNGQLEPSSFQVLNVAGNGLREVGIWMPSMRDSKEKNLFLKGVIWPGKSTVVPKGWEISVSVKKLLVGVPEQAGFPEFVNVERDPRTNATTITGCYIDLFDAVMAALPYNVRYEYVPFQSSSSRSYDDLSYQVFNGAFDAAVGDISITGKRSQYVDFSMPIEEGGITRTQKVEYENRDDKNIFTDLFRKELWLTAIALFMFTGFALWILEHRLNKAFRGPPSEHVGLIFYIPFMSVVFANRERIMSNLGRLVLVVWIFVVFILTSTYTASLSARLTAWKLQKDYPDIETLIRNGDSVGCREGSFIYSYLINLGFKENKIMMYKTAEQFENALSKGSNNGGIKALFTNTPYTNLFLSKRCNKFMTVGSPEFFEGFGFVFPKGSPLVADVSRAIIKLTDNRRITAIKSRWIRGETCGEPDIRDVRISLKSFKVLFAITGGVTATCLVLFLASYLYQNRDFVQRIANSGTDTWSKLRAMCKHFDQRDPKSFRSGRANEDGDQTASPTAARRSTVVPIPSDIELQSHCRVIDVKPDDSTATTEQARSV